MNVMTRSTSTQPAHSGASTPQSRVARLGGAAAVVTIVGGTVFVGGQPVGAATFEVTTLDAAGAGSLAERIDEANALAGPDTITFAPGLSGELDIGVRELRILDDLTIVGPGSAELTLTNQGVDNVLYLYNNASLTISGLTIDDAAGAAIRAQAAGSLSLTDVSVVDARGDGVDMVGSGDLTIVDSVVMRSGTLGIDVDASDNLAIVDTRVSSNGGDGIEVTDSGDVGLTGLTSVSNNGSGADLDRVGDITVVESEFRFDDYDSIDVNDAGSVVITDSSARFTESFVDAGNLDGPFTIERVTVDRAFRDAIDVSTVTGDVTVRSMTVTNVYEYALDLGTVGDVDTPSNVVIEDVTVETALNGGIDVSTVFGSLTVTDVSVTDALDEYAVDISGVRGPVLVERLDMSVADGGLDITSSSSTVTVRDVTATTLRDEAVNVSSVGDVVVERVVVDRVYDGSVDLFSSGGTVTVSDLSVTAADEEIDIDGDQGVTVTDVSISGVLDGGALNLDSNNGDVVAERITIDFAEGDGLRVSDAGGDVTLRDITVSNVDADAFDFAAVDGELLLERATVNDAQRRGIDAKAMSGSIAIADVSISSVDDDAVRIDSVAQGASLVDVDITDAGAAGVRFQASGPTSIDSSTITNVKNRGVFGLNSGDLTVTNSTIADNSIAVAERGAGIHLGNTDATIVASTITDNSGPLDGAAIQRGDGSSATVVSSIVVANDGLAAFGDDGTGGTLTVENTLVDTGAGLGGTTIETDDALLGAVQDNGGSTRTAKPAPGSPAIDAVTGVPEPTDQRGVTRPQGEAADLGAVEVAAGVVDFDPASVTVDEAAGTAELTLVRSGGSDGDAAVDVATVDGTAIAGDDFTSVAETVTFLDGATIATVSIPIVDDGIDESDETFTATISNPSVVTVGASATATVTVTDDDEAEAEAEPEAEPEPEVEPEPDAEPEAEPESGADQVISVLAPARFADTRPTGETFDDVAAQSGKLDAEGELLVPIAGRGGVPADAVGVVMNVTAIQAEGVGFVTAHACLDPRPNTSALNYSDGVNLGNEVIVSLDASGAVCLFSSASAHLTVDVVGFISADSPLQAVTPARLVDTRDTGATEDGDDQGGGKTTPGDNRTISVGGRVGVPADAAAVIVNVTAVGATDNGFITVHPCVDPVPTASSLNHVAGVNRGNELVASLDANGDMCVFTSASVHLTIDVVGYIPAETNFASVAPARLFDTRPSAETVDGQADRDTKLAANEEVILPIGGRAGVPAGATAAIVNITSVAPEGVGFITAHPCVEPRPNASSLNFVGGINGGNEVIASLDANGDLCLFTSAATHLTVDVVGYFE